MANQEHLDLLKQGSSAWNAWRDQHKKVRPDLSRADLREANLSGADLSEAYLSGADLSRADLKEANLNYSDLSEAYLSGAYLSEADLLAADLRKANLSRANLSEAHLSGANLSGAYLSEADLSEANLSEANLSRADLSRAKLIGAYFTGADLSEAYLSEADLSIADLREANLTGAKLIGANLGGANLGGADLTGAVLREARLIQTNLTRANLTQCFIYGISVWNVRLDGAKQDNLVITHYDEPTITVDNLKIAQFIYLLLNNEEIRDIIDTLTTKSVLILGRFTPERKAVLDALREALRQHNYLPILFDFEKPASRDITETVSTLAHLARFVIADITEAKSIPQELEHIVPHLPSVPVQPLLLASDSEYGMFEHFPRYPWVLPIYRYHDVDELLKSIQEHVIDPAEQKAKELAK